MSRTFLIALCYARFGGLMVSYAGAKRFHRAVDLPVGLKSLRKKAYDGTYRSARLRPPAVPRAALKVTLGGTREYAATSETPSILGLTAVAEKRRMRTVGGYRYDDGGRRVARAAT